MRFFELTIVAAILVTAVALYAFKYDTQHERDQISNLKIRIAAKEDAIRVLQAEWSLLNQPDRLQKLASKFLELKPLEASQIQQIADLPRRSDGQQMQELVRRTLDNLQTGSIVPR